jgi:hypothetical protein
LPAHQQVAAEQVRPAREEDPVDRPAHLLHPGAGPRSGDDDDVPRRHTHHQLARHHALQLVPEPVGQQHAGLEAVEGEHQGRRLAVDAHPIQRRVQVLGRLPAQLAVGELEAVEVVPGEQALPRRRPWPPRWWTGRVRHGQLAHEPVDEGSGFVHAAALYQDGQDGGTSHLHV